MNKNIYFSREYIKLNCVTKYAALTVIDFNHLLILYNVKPPLNVHEIGILFLEIFYLEPMKPLEKMKKE